MYAKLLCAAVLASGTLSMAAFAEAPVQAGETLESLSQVKVTTTINGQPGSLAELVNSGKVQLIPDQQTAPQTAGQTPMALRMHLWRHQHQRHMMHHSLHMILYSKLHLRSLKIKT